jgi:hypothetical protein
MVLKASAAFALPRQLATDGLAAAAGLMLALRWSSGLWPLDPWPFGRRFRTPPPSARVLVGSRHCRRWMVRETI